MEFVTVTSLHPGTFQSCHRVKSGRESLEGFDLKTNRKRICWGPWAILSPSRSSLPFYLSLWIVISSEKKKRSWTVERFHDYSLVLLQLLFRENLIPVWPPGNTFFNWFHAIALPAAKSPSVKKIIKDKQKPNQKQRRRMFYISPTWSWKKRKIKSNICTRPKVVSAHRQSSQSQ